ARTPPGFLGEALLPIEINAVASPQHPLHQLQRELTEHDLRMHRQLVVRDTGLRRQEDAGWLGAEERWTLCNLATSIRFVTQGLGFAWIPKEHIRPELEQGLLQPLPLEAGGKRSVELYLVFADRDSAGPATQALAKVLHQICDQACGRKRRQGSGSVP